MNNMFDISIITPSLNAERFIDKCLITIKSQKKILVQHIIVDAGSKDLTLKKIEKNNFSEVYFLKDSTIYEALNYGVSKAKSNIIGFLNIDDFYESEYILYKVLLKFRESKSNKLVYGNCKFINERGNILYKLRSPKNLNYQRAKKRVFNISHPSWFIEKKLFLELGGFDINLKYVSDCDLIIKALRKGVVFAYLKEDISNFLIHSNNKSKSINAKKEFLNYFQKHNGKDIINKIFHYLLTIGLYIKDIRFFLYKLNQFIKKIIRNFR
tara:strand:+ start:838 stop:1641 length:804 start_codon:yes stop_codon:yes gene_type:complete